MKGRSCASFPNANLSLPSIRGYNNLMIDIEYDYRKDPAVIGKNPDSKRDPDRYSKKLKEDHSFLWSKELPKPGCGKLDLKIEGNRLVATINGEVFTFGSDSITNCFGRRGQTEALKQNHEIDLALKKYDKADCTIGSFIIFPLKRDDGKTRWTINQARGCLRRISDRIDLTLECIRIFYKNKYQETPLQSCLIKYSRFFEWFVDFEHYVKFFLLDDLVSDNYEKVIGFTETIDFDHAMPISSVEEYKDYIEKTTEFIEKRNKRIDQYQKRLIGQEENGL